MKAGNNGRKKVISPLVISVVFAILCILCIVRIAMPNRTYKYDINGSVSADSEEKNIVICDNITLPVGIYNVELEYTPKEEDISAWFYLEDSCVFDGGLLCDGDVLWSGREKTKCSMTLLESTETLRACLRIGSNTTEISYGTLTIYETDLLWTTLLALIVFCWLSVIALMLFARAVKAKKISKERLNEVFVLVAISIVASMPFLVGTLPSGADTGYHLERIESVAYSIRDGVFPIRLEAYYPFGYGYANGLFYCDLSLYIPGILRVLGFSVQTSFNIFGIICVIAGVASSFYCFKKIFNNSYVALLGVALNNLALYRLFDTIPRGGTGFMVAVIFYPILIYGFYRLFSEDIEANEYRTVWIPISIGYTGILCSHILSLEIAAFWSIIVALIMIVKLFRKKTLLELLKAFGATVLLNIWFLVPFFDYYVNEDLRIKNVSARTIQDAGLRYSHFLRVPFKAEIAYVSLQPKTSLQLMNTVVLVLVLLFVLLWILGCWRKYNNTALMGLAKISAIFCIVSVILSLDVFPWDWLHSLNPLFEKLISTIQFPYRFIGFADLYASLTVCALIWGVWQYRSNVLKYALSVITVASLFVYSVFGYEYNTITNSNLKMYDMSMQIGYLSGGEYVINGMEYENIRPWLTAKTSDNIELTEYEKKDLAADVVVINNSSEEGYVDVPLLHYKDYRAYAADGTNLECVRSDEYCVRTIIPAGYSGQISVKFVSPWYWRVSEVIGYISWILLVIYIIRKRREAKK